MSMRPKKAIPRKSPPRKRNQARAAREFERCLHSKQRQTFVQSRPCVVSDGDCQYYTGKSVNAHVVDDGSKGGSRRSGYRCVTEMCDWHHHVLDTFFRRPEFEERYHIDLQACADRTQAEWLAFCGDETEGEP